MATQTFFEGALVGCRRQVCTNSFLSFPWNLQGTNDVVPYRYGASAYVVFVLLLVVLFMFSKLLHMQLLVLFFLPPELPLFMITLLDL